MCKATVRPDLAGRGVCFRVTAGSVERDCIISKNALAYLARAQGAGSDDFMNVYSRFEDDILEVARRLLLAGESASPLILGAAYFVSIPANASP